VTQKKYIAYALIALAPPPDYEADGDQLGEYRYGDQRRKVPIWRVR
jgi:hypothetical protein